MSRYTRFPIGHDLDDNPLPRSLKENPIDSERLFRRKPAVPLTREERTTQVAKQIVMEESEKRRTLSETLRAARLERAERFAENARKKHGSKPYQ